MTKKTTKKVGAKGITTSFKKLFNKVKRAFRAKRYIKLGKINLQDDIPCVQGIDERLLWSADEYLAAIIRDYIYMIEKAEYHIGAAAFDEFPFMPHNKMIDSQESEEEIESSKRWHQTLLETANMFDEYIKAVRELNMEFDYEAHLDKAFTNMKRIFMDLWV